MADGVVKGHSRVDRQGPSTRPVRVMSGNPPATAFCPVKKVRTPSLRRPTGDERGVNLARWPVVLFALLYSVFRLVLQALIDQRRPDADLRLELLVLRHQLGILQRQVKRPRCRLPDRLLLSAYSQRLPRPTWSCFLVSPQTLLRWHRGAAQEVAVPAGGSPAGVIPSTAP